MYTVSNLQEFVWRHLTPEIKEITIDCDCVQYVDSSFLQFITGIVNQIKSLKIINASRTIRKIFDITGLNHFLAED